MDSATVSTAWSLCAVVALGHGRHDAEQAADEKGRREHERESGRGCNGLADHEQAQDHVENAGQHHGFPRNKVRVSMYVPRPGVDHLMFQVYLVNLPIIGIGPHTSLSWLP
jgi:hypothetical protein